MQTDPTRPADRAVLPTTRDAVPMAGVSTMLASSLSTQLGAAIGSLAFPALGPVGVVAIRQYVAAAVLLAVGRPRLRSFTRDQWGLVLLLAAVFSVVNLSLYTAIDRIGLGLAVTLEFLGPLAIALAGSRRRVDLGCALLAAAGVVVLMRPRPTADYLGMGLALLAAACWASYILLNRSIGQRIPGAQGTAAAAGLSALVYLPIGAGVALHHTPSAGAVGAAVAAGILSSAVPFLADLFALRRVPAEAFGLFMSVNPVFAAAVGVLVLGQQLDVTAWLSIAANAISILTQPSPLDAAIALDVRIKITPLPQKEPSMPGVTLTDHLFSVPLDHDQPAGEHIEVYAREVVAAGRERERLPWLLFLQGGPGMLPPRPIGRDSWLDRALDDYRVLLLDQRGTGRSTPITRQTLPGRGEPAAQADYLTHFRADAIVRDAELIRRELAGEPWSVLGQSFGGMCTVTYLSFAPEGLREAIITGGLPGLRVTADEVYRATYPRVHGKNTAYYRRFPQDTASVRRIAAHLIERPAPMPDGSLLTVEAFQSLGLMLGTRDGADVLHYLLEDTWAGAELSDSFLARAAAFLSYAQLPLNPLMHELTYAQRSTGATNWAAERVRGEFPQFDARRALAGDDPVLFTGEMTYRCHFDQPCLAPLREPAEMLFARDNWPDLYDPQRLAANEVPVAAAVYLDDMYVDATYSLQTAETIRGLRLWATNEHEHDGLRVSSGRVLDHLLRMLHGEI